MPYRCYIDNRHDLRGKDVYVYLDTPGGSFLLVPDTPGYRCIPVDPMTDNREHGPTIHLSDEWSDAILSAWLESEHGHTGSESLLNDRLSIETERVDKLMDKLLEQL